ncbi:dipeptide ABC transporter ATP-binding protein [Nonomuraea turcica]|uniref:dipeptide ABC transporter ATP-binding protein n=1 Tax=Nonomuraea sp. G32 TaxID=3067274 RepID=UPI00273C7C60|nr:ABC transporter ATP-binding protein [Nonomuraea sp. G32]MDP4501818.1 ABC transporter ATP-binding protein [Nonomuraea sp. G32]
MSSILDVRGLTVEYPAGPAAAVRDLSFSIGTGEVLGLIGESGSGKTTAAKAILRLLPPSARVSGQIAFEGSDLASLSDKRLRGLRWERLSLVPQAAMNCLDPVQRVDRQLAEVIRMHRRTPRKQAMALAREALDKVGIPADRAAAYPHQYSGGMRQRALIAMATLLKPDLLIADEPTTGLDVIVQDRIMALLADAKRELGLSMLLVTHDLGVAAEICDRVVVLKDGAGIESGPVAAVMGAPQHPYTRRLLHETAARPSGHGRQQVGTGPVAVGLDRLEVRHATGRGLATLRGSRQVAAVDDVSMLVREGEIVGLAGESGCGKSSLVSALVGLTAISGGRVRIGQTTLGPGAADWRPLRSQVQLVFQDPYQSLNPRLTVRREVAEPLLAQLRLPEEEVERRVIAALEAAELRPAERYAARRPHELSGGERQRVAIARALVLEPRVLLADEPVSMLDRSTGGEIVRLLRRLAEELRVAVVLVSHDLSVLRQICDRIGIMYLGRLVETGPAHQVLEHPRHPYTRALLDAVPSPDPSVRRTRVLLPGEPPSALDRPPGCAFHDRCHLAKERCHHDLPALSSDAHAAACWFPMNGPSAVSPI